ncbi:MAG: GyrI-like domain-containing protein [Dermabacter sp.]|nr:GyrI-like domain-containing protein [Dermabacter sp.]
MPTSFSPVPGGSLVTAPSGFANLTILDQPAVPCVVVNANNIPMAELGSLFDPAFSHLPAVIAEAGLEITAPALAAYYRIGGVDHGHATCDIAAGFPVSAPLEAPATLGDTGLVADNWELPAGRIAALTHLGGYDGLQESWNALMTTMTERGLSPQAPFWEVYVSMPGPDADLATQRTDLFVPLGPLTAG